MQHALCCGTPRIPVHHAFGKHGFARAAGGGRRHTQLRAAMQQPEEPDFDQLKLDDAYYKEMGLDEDELDVQKTYEPDDIGAQRQQ